MKKSAAVGVSVHNTSFPDNILGYNELDETFYISCSFFLDDAGTSDEGSIIYDIPVTLMGMSVVMQET